VFTARKHGYSVDIPSVTVGNTARHTQLIQLRVKQRHFPLVGCAVTYRVFTWSDRRTDNCADSCFVQTDVRPVAPTIARTIAATIASCKHPTRRRSWVVWPATRQSSASSQPSVGAPSVSGSYQPVSRLRAWIERRTWRESRGPHTSAALHKRQASLKSPAVWQSPTKHYVPLCYTFNALVASSDLSNLTSALVGYVLYWYWHCPHDMRSSVNKTIGCPSVCLSQYSSQQQTLLLQPDRQEISIDCCTAHSSAACGRPLRVVPRCQRT